MKGMILAAGFGTRFRPVTFEIPKPMVPLCNRPLIGYAIEPLLDAGVREVIVNLHHLPDTLEAFLKAEYGERCEFEFSFEPEILGTGGGIRKVRQSLKGEQDFFLVNGDTVQFPSFEALRDARRGLDALAALTLRHPPAGDRFTKVFFDGTRITGFGSGSGEALMFSGSHCISNRIFDYLPDRDYSGITEDVYLPVLRDASESIAGVVSDGIWFDIGTPLRYQSASSEILSLMVTGGVALPMGSRIVTDSLIAAHSIAEGQCERSILGFRSSVGAGSTLHNSILWNDVKAPKAFLTDSIVAHGVELPAGARFDNALVSRRLEGVDYNEAFTLAGDLVAVPIDPARPASFS